MILQELGQKIRDLRKKAKISQAELAELTGFTQSEISLFENRGEKITSVERIDRLLNALGYQIELTQKKRCYPRIKQAYRGYTNPDNCG